MLLDAPAQCRKFGLASSGGWVGAADMAGDGLGAGPRVALEGADGGVAGPCEQHGVLVPVSSWVSIEWRRWWSVQPWSPVLFRDGRWP